MGYVVYVNHPTNKAIVHNTDCSRYVNRKRDKTSNGYWTIPFPTQQAAWNYAKSTGKKTIDSCAFCCS